MYDLIESLIDHAWQSNYTSDQQYIYYITGAAILLLLVVFIDFVYRFLNSIFRGGF